MESNDLDETIKDVTSNHYVAYNIAMTSPYEKHYYCVMPLIDISFIEVSIVSSNWLVIGVADLPDSRIISLGDALKVNPINQNNIQHAHVEIFKNSKPKEDITDKYFINKVYVNVYRQNDLLLGMVNNHRYFIEVHNTRNANAYYNIQIKFTDWS